MLVAPPPRLLPLLRAFLQLLLELGDVLDTVQVEAAVDHHPALSR